MEKTHSSVGTLPPLEFRKQKTVFLDLDETLSHSVESTPPTKYDFKYDFVVKGKRKLISRKKTNHTK